MTLRRIAVVLWIVAACGTVALAQGKDSLVVKLDTEGLPEGARLRLGKLGGFRYAGPFNGAILSADARLLAVVSSSSGAIEIVDTTTGKRVQTLKTQVFGSVAGMAFSPDGKMFAMESFGQDLRVFEIASGKQVHQIAHKNNGGGRQGAITFSADGKVVAIGSEQFNGKDNKGQIKAWEVASGKLIGPFETLHNYNVRAVVAPDGKTMMSFGNYSPRGAMGPADREIPKTIQVWDLATGKEARQLKLDFGPQGFGNIIDAAISPDGKTVAVTSGASTFHLLDYDTGKETRRFAGQRGNNHLRFAPDGQTLAAFDQIGGAVQAWNVANGHRLELVDGPRVQAMGVGFPGKNRVTVLGNLSQSLIWWDATAVEKASAFEGHMMPIVGLAYAPDGKTLITAGADQRLLWWNTQTGAEVRELRLFDDDARYYGGPRNMIGGLSLSPDGRYAASGSNSGNGGVRLWNLKTGKVVCDLEGSRTYSQPGIAFSPDSTKIAASGAQFPMHIWNLQTGQELPRPPALNQQNAFDSGNPARLAFAPNGQIVAVHLNHYDRFTGQPISDLLLWDIVKEKQLHRIQVPNTNLGLGGGSGNLAFSLDSRYFAVSNGAGAILLFSVETGQEWRRLMTGRNNSAFQLTFSADGRFLAAGSVPRNLGVSTIRPDEPVVEVWELAGGLKRDQYKGHSAAITGLAFSPDAMTLASASMDTTILLWDLTGKSGPKVSPLDAADLPAAWKSLSGRDPGLSMTMRRMTNTPGPTVDFLTKSLLPVAGIVIDEKKIDNLVRDLDSEAFLVRERSAKELRRLGERAEPALQRGLERGLSAEARRRIQDILAGIVRVDFSPDELQAIRGVEVLERIGSSDAREWLSTLAKGDPLATTTREAAKALKRMAVK